MSRLRRGDLFSLIELLLLALMAVQLAHLVWTVVTPIGPYGDWRPRQAAIPSSEIRKALFSSFDPFFRTTGQDEGQIVTSLNLTLFGTRINEGSGDGSAILATPDQMQGSYAPGDEILPGVTLKSVSFDHVVIDRGGRDEMLFIDQSAAAPSVRPGNASAARQLSGPPTLQDIQRGINFAPRTAGGRVTGINVSPSGSGDTFRLAGFQPGDVIVQINGQAISSASDIQTLTDQLQPTSSISLQVERGGSIVPVTMILSSQ